MSWDALSAKFLNRFFLSRRTKEIRGKILRFFQKDIESLSQDCNRYKGYLRDCLYHHQPKKIIGHHFIDGLRPDSNCLLDVIA